MNRGRECLVGSSSLPLFQTSFVPFPCWSTWQFIPQNYTSEPQSPQAPRPTPMHPIILWYATWLPFYHIQGITDSRHPEQRWERKAGGGCSVPSTSYQCSCPTWVWATWLSPSSPCLGIMLKRICPWIHCIAKSTLCISAVKCFLNYWA